MSLIVLIASLAEAHAEALPNCDSFLEDWDPAFVKRTYQEAPSLELKIQILQRFPYVVPDSTNQIRLFALQSIFLDLEAKRSDFLNETSIPLRALGDVGISKDLMLLDQVIRSGKNMASYVAMISKEKISARVENRPPNIGQAVINSKLVQNIMAGFRDMPFSAKDVNIRLRVLEPFMTAQERPIVIKLMLETARSEIQFIVYGLENDSYNFTNVEKKFPAYYYVEYLSHFGDESDVKLLEKLMKVLAPKAGPDNEEIAFRQYHFTAAGVAAIDLRSRLKMGHVNYDHSGQGD